MFERLELNLLRERGFALENPYQAVEEFEMAVAQFAGAPFAVAVDCCTHALELSLRLLSARGPLRVPRHTYPSVAMLAPKLGLAIEWSAEKWNGIYRIDPYPVIDASLRFHEGMYVPGTFFCLSLQHKKRIPIGRGGMILTEDEQAYRWLKSACHDGRQAALPWKETDISMLGYHYYLTPEDAARGLLLFLEAKKNPTADWKDLGGWQDYPDISKMSVFQRK